MSFLILNILESFLGECRGNNEVTSQSRWDCPACSADKNMPNGDGKGNLEINYDKGVYKCWSCKDINNMHGPIIKLLKEYGTNKNIRDYFLIKPDENNASKNESKEIQVLLPEEFKLLSECTTNDYKSDLAKSYLYKRGLNDEIIKKFKIGYAFKGKYFNRIIIPSFDKDGVLNYFVARWFPKEKTKVKYLNPDVEKQEIIFNEKFLNLDATIYLVEGAFDHLVIPNSIPLLGKYISPKLLDLLHDYAMGYIVILLDGDAKLDSLTLFNNLNFGKLRDRIKICVPPENYDPSKIYEKLGNKGIVKLLMSSRKPNIEELIF